MLTPSEVLTLIRGGENSEVEYKEVRIRNEKVQEPKRNPLSDELAAFANQNGGTIIFGVADKTKQIVGIDPSDLPHLAKYISEICTDTVKPPIVDIHVSNVEVADELGDPKFLLYVIVNRSLWLHESAGGHFYRLADSKRKMSTDHLLRVAQTRSQARVVHFDELAVTGTDKSALDSNLLLRFVRNTDSKSLHKRRLLTPVKEEWIPTVSGVLMCCSTPEKFLYNSFIQAVRYNGLKKDANYQVDAKDICGPLDKQIIDAFNFVHQHNQLAARKDVGRREIPQYSMRAVFEALVNAVVHRDYSIHGSKIRLFMFADRIEIYSPGALANTLTVENLDSNQSTRNELLSRLLSELSLNEMTGKTVFRKYFLERRGEGVGIINSESTALSGRCPVYELFGDELRLTIFAADPGQ